MLFSLFSGGDNDLTQLMTRLIIQLGIILLAAKLSGELCQRYLKIPSVLGELFAGILIGPYALGGIHILNFGALFPINGTSLGSLPISVEIYFIAQIASIILLFVVGLETEIKLFLKYGVPALVVALGGVIFPFILGLFPTYLLGFSDSLFGAQALFMGTIMTATSVGITARVLEELRSLDSPEGVTILAAAVVDDVIGMIILAIVVGISTIGIINEGEVIGIGAKAIGVWLILTIGGILIAPFLGKVIGKFQDKGAAIVLFIALGCLGAAIAELFGLAMIIGAYSIGLALSRTKLKTKIHEPIMGVYNFLVPIFFVVMGMQVNLSSILGDNTTIIFGLIISVLGIISKVFGSGIPALFVGFTRIGAMKIGFGMLPRGEVSLIIAQVGLSKGIIDQDLYAVAIMLTITTTILAPILLIKVFKKTQQ